MMHGTHDRHLKMKISFLSTLVVDAHKIFKLCRGTSEILDHFVQKLAK